MSFCFEILAIEVLRWVVADTFSIDAKICQFPPAMEVAPDVAMQTMVSTPWIRGRFCA